MIDYASVQPIVEQILALLSLIAGILLAEVLAQKAFGRLKTTLHLIGEIVLFIVFIVVLNEVILFKELDFGMMLASNFVVGLTAMLLASVIVTGLGFLSTVPERIRFSKHSKEETLIIMMFELLAENGIHPDETRQKLIKKGFPKRLVEKIYKTYKFKVKPHPLTKKMHKILRAVK